MEKQEALSKLKALNRDNGNDADFEGHDRDFESDHIDADNILCDFLKSLGHEDIVEAFDNVGKWYS